MCGRISGVFEQPGHSLPRAPINLRARLTQWLQGIVVCSADPHFRFETRWNRANDPGVLVGECSRNHIWVPPFSHCTHPARAVFSGDVRFCIGCSHEQQQTQLPQASRFQCQDRASSVSIRRGPKSRDHLYQAAATGPTLGDHHASSPPPDRRKGGAAASARADS